MNSTLQSLYFLAIRECLTAFRNRHEALSPLIFFSLVCVLFPLGVGASADLLRTIAPGIIWVAALLAILMSLGTLFRHEYEQGTLELMVLSEHPLIVLVVIKLVAYWLITALPLIVVAPFMAYGLGLTADAQGVLLLTLLLGTPVLILVGAIASTLTLVIPQNGMLLALLVLPLYVPVLIFATSAVNTVMMGGSAAGALYILAALCVLSVTLSPLAIVAALKIGVSQ